ncbi:MAG TPA: ribulose-phosphate 3-epimerase [Actinomycetota bacterium]|nr:ribulose-phosphate 3-epimerase [Actinomycetota bacterium]
MKRVQIAPSILTADFGRIAEEVALVAPLVDWFHLDVMDGHYVDNLTFGASTVAAIDRAVETPLHVHLMIENPEKFAPVFAEAGADRISFHPEVTEDPDAVLSAITDAGAGAGVAVHPDTGLDWAERLLDRVDVVLMMTVRPGFGGQKFLSEVVPKIADARKLVDQAGSRADIEVDGGVNLQTLAEAVGAGADVLVTGSAVYDGRDPVAAAKRIRERLDTLAPKGGR